MLTCAGSGGQGQCRLNYYVTDDVNLEIIMHYIQGIQRHVDKPSHRDIIPDLPRIKAFLAENSLRPDG